MPVLKFLADTNVISARIAREEPVLEWLSERRDQVAISIITLAEIRRGIEIKPEGKARRRLERDYRYLLQEYSERIWVFDEAAAAEWGRLMAEAQAHNHPLPFADSLICAIARSMGATMVTRDNQGFIGCPRIDPWTGLEHAAW